MKDQDRQDKQDKQGGALPPTTSTPSSSSPPPPLKPLRASEEMLAKIDPRLRKIYEHYGKWSKVARKFGYTERGIASWARNGIPECREGRVNEVVREIEGKGGKTK